MSEKHIWIFEKISEFLFLIFSNPSNHVGTLISSLSNSTKAQGTLLDFHRPPNGPQNGPCEANFWGTSVKKGPSGSHLDRNWSIFLDSSLDNGQTQVCPLSGDLFMKIDELIVWAMMGPCRALFYQGSPEISLPGSIWGSILGSMKVQEGPLSLGRVGQWPNKCSNMVRRAREYQK